MSFKLQPPVKALEARFVERFLNGFGADQFAEGACLLYVGEEAAREAVLLRDVAVVQR